MAFSCYQSSKWNLIFSSAEAVCSIYFHVSLEGNDLSPFQSVSTPTSSLGRSDQLPKPLIMFQTHFKLHRHQLEYQNIRSTLVTTSIKEWGRFGLKKKKKSIFSRENLNYPFQRCKFKKHKGAAAFEKRMLALFNFDCMCVASSAGN